MEWQDAQKQVLALSEIAQDCSTSAWKDYYIQLYRMLIFLDPSKSMSVHHPYILTLDTLIHKLPKEYQQLKWHATRKLSRLYILDNNQQKAFNLLEETVQDVLNKEHRTAQDTLYLKRSMEGQLYCYKILPKKTGTRNMRFLSTYSKTSIDSLALALYRKDYKNVIGACETMLDNKGLSLIEMYYIGLLLEDILARTPASNQHAACMFRLLQRQKELQQGISQRLSFDYQKYQELQEKSRIEAEIKQRHQEDYIKSARKVSILGLLIVLLMAVVWLMFYRLSAFRGQILKKVRKEQESRKATLVETQKAYASQVQLIRNLNHDIRVPLNALIGFSEMLCSNEELTPETQKEAGSTIRKSSQELLYIINNLLSIARLESDKMSVHIEQVPICQLTDQGLWAGVVSKLGPTHLLEFKPEMSGLRIETDLGHVRHIIELTISDIVRQTTSGSVLVTCRVDDNSQRICISTQGPSKDLAVEFMREALNIKKSMSDYEDANSYYLVLARMIARLIGGELVLNVDAKTVYLELWLPIKNNIQSTIS